jgi:drug/metabolite transporter (DMT)-like permease
LSKQRAWVAFWVLALIWGSSFLFIRIGVEQLGPFQLVFIRTGIAAIGLNIVLVLRGKRLPVDWAGIRPLIVLGVVNTVVPFALITWGEQYIESGLASVLQGTAALFTLLIAHFVFADERITTRKIFGLVMGFLGVVILASRSTGEEGALTGNALLHLLGQLAIVAASFCYGLGGTYSRKVIQNRLEPIVVAAGTMTVAAIITGIITYAAPLLGGPQPLAYTALEPRVLMAVLMLGFLNTLIAYTMFYSIVQALGAARTSMVTYVVPVCGLTLGAIFLNEIVDFRLLLGAVLIIGGIGVVNLRLNRLGERLRARVKPI